MDIVKGKINKTFAFVRCNKISLPPLEQKIATNYRCKGMPLSSFLLKPMQRITRYPLLIKNVCREMLFICNSMNLAYHLFNIHLHVS